jgi:putative ABC transport system permease protein
MSLIPLSFRLMWRELRFGVRGFGVFLACLALGVWAMAAVGSLSTSLSEGLNSQARVILGGDLAFSIVQREAPSSEKTYLASLGKLSTIATLRGMVRTLQDQKVQDETALVELKAVDAAYPFLGVLETTPLGNVTTFLSQNEGVYGAIVDPLLLARLNIKLGDTLAVGNIRLKVVSTVISEPDRVASGVSFGPRMMISEDALRASGLLQPGSLVRWTYRIALDDNAQTPATMERIINESKVRFPDAGWEVRSKLNVDARLAKNIERFTQFLALVGLTALGIGGMGVANAVRAYLDRRREHIAILKTLGATGGRVVRLYLVHILALALMGIGIGVVLGALTPFAISALIGSTLPLPFTPVLAPFELMSAALYGLMIAFAFSIIPLGRAHDLSVGTLFRDHIAPASSWPRRVYILAALSVAVILIALTVSTSIQPRIAAMFVLTVLVMFALLYGLGRAIMAAAKRLPSSRFLTLRLAITNIHRPAALTPSFILSAGLGIALLGVIVMVDVNLRNNLRFSLPQNAPTFFMMDISGNDGERFEETVRSVTPQAVMERVPMMRGRIIKVKGVDADTLKVPDNISWVLDGDRGVTFAANPPAGSKVVEGSWWSASDTTEPLVSLDREIAEGLGVKVGDILSVSVLGRTIEAKIANLRQIEWRTYGINFVMVFSPHTFKGAPFTQLATLSIPDNTDVPTQARLIRTLTQNFPTLTSIRVKEAVQTASNVVQQIASAIRGASLLVLFTGLLVLAGTLTAAHRTRLYEAMILKTLGATRSTLIRAHAYEYGVLVSVAALIGLMMATLISYAFITFMLKMNFAFPLREIFLPSLAFCALFIALGLFNTARILKQKPASHLRDA